MLMSDPVALQSATTLRRRYAQGVVSPVEVVDELASRAEEWEPRLNCLVTPAFECGRRAAHEAAEHWRDGRPRPLEGIPVLVKDVVDTAGLRTTYGSGMFAGHVPDADAAVVERIRRAGGIVLAKSATHEFAWGFTTESRQFGRTRNPWSTDRTPGGSSGGSAAALAAGYAPLALGSDTGGSIRIPAAFCGVTGLRPTYGAVDLAGVHPLAPSLDLVGPMARTVEDLRLLWSVIGIGADPVRRSGGVTGVLTVGVLTTFDGLPLSGAAVDACEAAAATLADDGLRVLSLRGDVLPPAGSILAATVLAEGRRIHRCRGLWPDRADDYSDDVRVRLELADAADPADYVRAQRERARMHAAMSNLFMKVDVLLSPVSAIGPNLVGTTPESFRKQVSTCIAPQSLAGLPALTVRAGFDADGLPVGIQLTAPAWQESRLLDVGARYQGLTSSIQDRWPTGAPVRSSAYRQ
jgi:aspartyl-tRNA(Asn)/glutamyl-tRNA(Gln) amidotransferase subunit A